LTLTADFDDDDDDDRENFQDCMLHISAAGLLWVWSAVGLKRAREAFPSIDPNHAKTLAYQAVVV
jgi:hypothetical protein